MYNESLISTVIYIDESVEQETYTLLVLFVSFQIYKLLYTFDKSSWKH